MGTLESKSSSKFNEIKILGSVKIKISIKNTN